ncbi:DeoR/GlpR transcriptional regulator [Mesorhizobium sp. M1A.F.Ca.IN.020.06.1.1]|uniref:DeoR/GlpR family DNA-binding transcription regulator n=1 Tax=unclassified Mesorhizobium TaxID=325217 RepID=UPI000BAF6A85|nr:MULTISPECIES: DeoR/GlpR family DNA-binding transcription regulator [unclassified Mesorhizobium]PBB28920.1 DeoR family transcriptional regulator [Mesorhizobium sp. WSM3882]RUV08039.1 DeoR/GlpR transcriptional regulator [Mesorhizobium sp. M1A.F.Ca.IN.020.03.2.1]RUV89605.1 DeoR/GlpR transcriptional regulator [Mesorhizobium sp. M1A.F.Ca.IN.020.32.1.1]RUW14708.1 DeoR/GlpR transcriptional regulator [Mesorhizobium sp. M1A.F.Ca.IN.022.05.2.1]RUW37353.1 DeoR/GlpR transcriptional regulator [Mesorhizo
MLAEERQAIIRDRLSEHGKVLANALAHEFRVSEDTVRRDLRDLARAGLCRRVYGGALARASRAQAGPERLKISATDLAPLAAAAAKLVQPSATIIMHHAALCVAFAAALPRDISLTIVTNSPRVTTALEGHRQASAILLGGLFDHGRGCSLGTVALSQLEQFNADLFFVADCAVHPSVGLTAFDLPDAEIKRVMCRRSAARVVVATAESIAKTAPFQVSGPDAIDHMLAGRQLDAETLEPFRRQGTLIDHIG